MTVSTTIVHEDESDIKYRLAELGLTPEILLRSVLKGELEAQSCSPYDPPGAEGYERWRITVVGLRTELVPQGWKMRNPKNLPLVVDLTQGLAIAVASGSAGTGLHIGTNGPHNKNPKGIQTTQYIVENKRQMNLFDTNIRLFRAPKKGSSKKREKYVTWILLVHSTGRRVQCELSLPLAIDDKGYITRWKERILLPNQTVDEAPLVEITPGDPGDEPIQVAVTPRG